MYMCACVRACVALGVALAVQSPPHSRALMAAAFLVFVALAMRYRCATAAPIRPACPSHRGTSSVVRGACACACACACVPRKRVRAQPRTKPTGRTVAPKAVRLGARACSYVDEEYKALAEVGNEEEEEVTSSPVSRAACRLRATATGYE
jgi:hypothetical protein